MKKGILSLILSAIFILSPVSVFAEEEFPAATSVHEIPAKSAVLMDANSGRILFENNADEQMPPASITKIMTLLLTFEAIENGTLKYSDVIVCSEHAASMGGTQIWLESGEEMTAEDLIKATAINSANDASMAIAEHIGGSEEGFVAMMNEKAKTLGMENTNFVNPTGLDAENHYSSARDIAIMSRELLRHEDIKKFSTVWMDTLRNGETGLTNTNKLVRFYKGCTGLKTGTTDGAGSCLSASAERNGVSLIAVSMGSATSNERFASCRTLLDYGFSSFELFTPEVSKEELPPVKVVKGAVPEISLEFKEISPILLEKGKGKEVKKEIIVEEFRDAPVTKGDNLGKAVFSLNGETVAEIPLIASDNVEKMTFFTSFKILLRNLLAF